MEINTIHFDQLNSTNTWSKNHYHQFDINKITVVTADYQTMGRGRFDRHWVSPAGLNIYATFTFFMNKERKDVGNIPQVLAISCLKTLINNEIESKLKWPNDLLINKKKIAGILCETVNEAEKLVVVVGIGLNVNMSKEELSKINQSATSMGMERGQRFDIKKVLQQLVNYFKEDLELFLQDGFVTFLDTYRKHLIHKKGDLIRIQNKTEFFDRIDDDGTLITKEGSGLEMKHTSGEIT